MSMKVCRYRTNAGEIRAGLVADDEQHVSDLTAAGVRQVHDVLEADDPIAFVGDLPIARLPKHPIASVTLLAPVDHQEVWAAGVTYLRSKVARMEESNFSATAYDRVYDAPRPEIFFKSTPDKVVGPGDAVGIRRDATWSVPEPELVLVMNSRGRIAGCSIGNDMSSRDIEGENLLYLPQAKVYARSCGIGPWIALGSSESDARGWTIRIGIRRADREVFGGETSVAQIKRGFDELAAYLFRSQVFAYGAMLLTGTGIVPPDSFTLEQGDVVEIQISGIGTLVNSVVTV